MRSHEEKCDGLDAAQSEFEDARVMLACCLNKVGGEFTQGFPEGCQRRPGDREGMARLGSAIEDVAHCYDRFQAALGLRPGEGTRFASFFTGREGVGGPPPPWHGGKPAV